MREEYERREERVEGDPGIISYPSLSLCPLSLSSFSKTSHSKFKFIISLDLLQNPKPNLSHGRPRSDNH
ncbi:hypothetical protein HanXRQr2_Chr08g0325421 [Helianthus annuus]|uniref:Uncharacterized protein n=1 Tax=Helianthus annuus TaxID=4232 RepID=A0A251U4H3_HELAN|nr:hypothetical protein HanXRQr2_Chr08g0325421 [Helianthus annuus]